MVDSPAECVTFSQDKNVPRKTHDFSVVVMSE